MIETLTDLARGPLLKLSLLIMAAGLLRAFVLQVWELGRAWGRAGDQVIRWLYVAATLAGLATSIWFCRNICCSACWLAAI